jgi:hypothetical protein
MMLLRVAAGIFARNEQTGKENAEARGDATELTLFWPIAC